MNELQKKVVRVLQHGISAVEQPFLVAADLIGISEDELLRQLHSMKAKGVMRRFGAILRHQKAGFSANAMAVWNVPDEKIEEFAGLVMKFQNVSHCYERPRLDDFPYNIYTMIHGRSREEVIDTATKIANEVGLTEFELLHTTAEYKKSSPVFFEEGGECNEEGRQR